MPRNAAWSELGLFVVFNSILDERDRLRNRLMRCRSPIRENRLRARIDQCQRVTGKLADYVNGLSAMPYSEYLETLHWKNVREDALTHAQQRCQVCNSPQHLEVHHRTYDRKGCEMLSDLIVLCRSCHGLFHREGRLAQ
jgi:5-methylcytosine-specific restriction endonuclease McrA